jgi:hypothetical protein
MTHLSSVPHGTLSQSKTSTHDPVNDAPPILLTAKQSAQLCDASLRTWRRWDAAGAIPRAVCVGLS